MSRIRIIGVPLDLGASRRGVDMGPSALRIAQLEARLEALGTRSRTSATSACPSARPCRASACALDLLPAITEVCRVLSERTAAAIRDGFAPLVLGGDHSLGAGSVAGVATAFAERGSASASSGWMPTETSTRPLRRRPATCTACRWRISWVMAIPRMVNLARPVPAVLPQHTVLVGVRDLDPAERENIREVRRARLHDAGRRRARAQGRDARGHRDRDRAAQRASIFPAMPTGWIRHRHPAWARRCAAVPPTARHTSPWRWWPMPASWCRWTSWRSIRCWTR